MKTMIASHRWIKIEMWLARQPLNAAFNRKLEEAIAFKQRLDAWALRNEPTEISPTFHFQPGIA